MTHIWDGGIMKEHKHISIIYGTLLAIALVLSLGAVALIPIDTYNINDGVEEIELEPLEIRLPDLNEREFCFRGNDWETNGSCLFFTPTHQEVEVWADGEIIFKRNSVETIWGRTTGYSWEYVDIPPHTYDVRVKVIACYPAVREIPMKFYQGYSTIIFKQIIHEEIFAAVISLINICIGLTLLVYGIAMHKRTSIGGAMVYLGIFTVLLGVWSLTENGVVTLLFDNRAACTFIAFTSLLFIGIAFIMFLYSYLQPSDKYLHKVLLAINIINIIVVFGLQFLGIRDMRETVLFTHIAMTSAVLYLPATLVNMAKKQGVTRRFWVTVWSVVCMIPPLAYSLYMYYTDQTNRVGSCANVFIFMFVAIFAVDVSREFLRDIDAGKKAEIYQELAEKDLPTDCFNRNAYQSDTRDWTDLEEVLLVTCDLNNLKHCNDTFGHSFGDLYIADAANILKKVFSEYGKVYRIGGDEFCIIIPDKQKCDIGGLLDSINEEVFQYNKTSEVIRMGIAYGYAVYDDRTDSTMEDIRNRADEKMYSYKVAMKKDKELSVS
jgi:diguanylate cyclase (GGDEF)-like protein